MNDLLLQEVRNCTYTHCLKFLEQENWAQICYLSSFDEFKHQFLKYFLFLSSSLIYGELKVAWYDLELYACIEISFYLTRVSCYCFVFLISQFNPFQSQLVPRFFTKETKLKIVQCDWPSVWECQPSELWSQRLQDISTRDISTPKL